MYHVRSLYCLFQLLGHQCWKPEVDLSSPHPGGHCCKKLFMTDSAEGHLMLQLIHSSDLQVNFLLFVNIVRVLASKLWETNTGKLDPRQQYG